ncbi:MAG: hypothetical protein O7I93_15840 [Gemmatimonadetes bacterium]|nr:hypothetical protein [Gemmatimonadota bacterium]
MTIRGLFLTGLLWAGTSLTLHAQDNLTVRAARTAFDELEFPRAIVLAQQALLQSLSNADEITALEVLGFSYGSLDSLSQAVATFSSLIVLDPDRDPDPARFSPRLVNLYTQALARVLVVRHVAIDSAELIAGQGTIPIRFEVSRPAWATARIIGGGMNALVDSQLVEPGPIRMNWNPLTPMGEPLPAGTYQLIITAIEERNQFQGLVTVRVSHAAVDTLRHVDNMPGFTKQPELETPPRDWRPLGIVSIFTGVATGAALALEHSDLGGAKREIAAVSVASLLTGLVLSIKKPDPRPVPSNVLYNQLLDQMVDDRNAQIAQENANRRRQVVLIIRPEMSR